MKWNVVAAGAAALMLVGCPPRSTVPTPQPDRPAEKPPSGSPSTPSEADRLRAAVGEILRSRDGKAVVAESRSDVRPAPPAAEGRPPEGASAYPGLVPEQDKLSGPKVVRTLRETGKAPSELSGAPMPPPKWRQLGFWSETIAPDPGLDPRLETAPERIRGREHTYGFLLMSEYLSPPTQEALGRLGVVVLGPHGTAYKVKLPLDAARLKQVVELPYVAWLGYARPGQKLDKALQEAAKAHADRLERLPAWISFFEDEGHEAFQRELAQVGVQLGTYDSTLATFSAAVPARELEAIAGRDFVLHIELDQPTAGTHDQSMSSVGVDYIRPGGSGSRFGGAPIIVGIMDSGFMVGSAAATMHQDLNRWGCGVNYTSDAAGVWNDEHGHGTHVLGTLAGTGTADARYRGVATQVGSSASTRIRAAKIWDSTNSAPSTASMESALDFMDGASECGAGRPQLVNVSGGSSGNGDGTDVLSRKVDARGWERGQSYVVAAGNDAPGGSTLRRPGVAKNAITVGNVGDDDFEQVGDLENDSSRGPTDDGRMKPNLVAPGRPILSAQAGSATGYASMGGTSMATPHVAGIAATVMEHYPAFRTRPHLLRAHLMATSILHDDDVTPANNTGGGRNDYGLGRVSSYIANWARGGPNGWSTHWATHNITSASWGFRDITVPAGTRRLVVVMTWDENAASSGATSAVDYDLDLWVDRGADCTPDAKGQCGEFASQSWTDNVEYLVIDNPGAGTFRLKTINWDAPSSGIPAAIVATVIRGDPTPPISLAVTASTLTPSVGSNVTVTTRVDNPAYIASGVHVQRTNAPTGLTAQGLAVSLKDGTVVDFNDDEVTLGNIVQGDARSIEWRFRVDSAGPKQLEFRAWSENGGTQTQTVTLNP